MASRYTPEKKTIGNVLSMTNPPIVVPEWQRNYSWTTSEVETFWQDLLTFNSKYPNDTINSQEYFLGSIVVVDNNVSHLLLDGQQRLATSAILLSVIRDYLARFNKDAALRVTTRYLTDFDDSEDRNTYKLTLNHYDRDFFRREVLESRDGEYVPISPQIESHGLVRKARQFFVDQFQNKYDKIADPAQSHQWALRILKVLTNHMSVVAVISEDEDNAADVFETLNDRGIGLSTPDLLRNLVLRRATEDTIEEIIDLWGEIIGIESDANLKTFLRHYWLSREGDVKAQSLYREIKAKVVSENMDSRFFSRDLRDAAIVYRDLVSAQDEDEEISKMLDAIGKLGANVLYPAVMSGYDCGNTEDRKRLLQALVTTFVRHNVICGLENSHLETTTYSLAKTLRENNDFSAAIQTLKEFAPDDERFVSSFQTAAVSRRATARYILTELEQHRRTTEELEVAAPSRVHVEHIYPQTPQEGERWPDHSSMINRLGNLTLLSRRLNVTMRNAPFLDKKLHYGNSELVLTAALSEHEQWNQQKVEERQVALSESASEIWPFPEA